MLELAGKLPQEQPRIAQNADVGFAVLGQVLGAAVGRDVERAAADVVAVVQAEIGRHAGQQHQVGLLERLAAFVTQLQRVVTAQQAACHAGEIDRRADLFQRSGDIGDVRCVQRGLAAHD